MMRSKAKETVGARFDDELLRLLDKARQPFEDSRGEHVRRLVIAALGRQEERQTQVQLDELRATLAHLEVEVQKTHKALKRMTFALLGTSGKVDSAEAREVAAKLFEEI